MQKKFQFLELFSYVDNSHTKCVAFNKYPFCNVNCKNIPFSHLRKNIHSIQCIEISLFCASKKTSYLNLHTLQFSQFPLQIFLCFLKQYIINRISIIIPKKINVCQKLSKFISVKTNIQTT